MTEHAVVIAGAGPTGLMLAGELALAGVDVAIVERRESQELDGLRAGGLHIRTIEVLDQRGIAGRFLSQGQTIRFTPFADTTLDTSDLPARHNYFLAIWQTHTERILAGWLGELGVPVYRGCEVTSFTQNGSAVGIELSGGRSMHAQYLVGCDGGRSLIRRKAGIAFPGWDPSTSYLIAELETAQEPKWGVHRNERGINAFAKLDNGRRARVVLTEQHIAHDGEPALDDVREALIDVYGTDFGLRTAACISRFTDMARQAASYRNGRVLLAGDAAHVHSPKGGQGLNLGLQDAVNLGWKLVQVVRGISPENFLDTYPAERRPVAARVLRNTMALTAIDRSDDRIGALRDTISELLQKDETRRQYVAMMSGLDIRYDFGDGHPLLGRRMPDLDLLTSDGPLRLFTLLHDARPVLLNLGAPGAFGIAPSAGRVRLTDASFDGVLELPASGAATVPPAVLIRPDGYVAWVGDPTRQGLDHALTTWVGLPR